MAAGDLYGFFGMLVEAQTAGVPCPFKFSLTRETLEKLVRGDLDANSDIEEIAEPLDDVTSGGKVVVTKKMRRKPRLEVIDFSPIMPGTTNITSAEDESEGEGAGEEDDEVSDEDAEDAEGEVIINVGADDCETAVGRAVTRTKGREGAQKAGTGVAAKKGKVAAAKKGKAAAAKKGKTTAEGKAAAATKGKATATKKKTVKNTPDNGGQPATKKRRVELPADEHMTKKRKGNSGDVVAMGRASTR